MESSTFDERLPEDITIDAAAFAENEDEIWRRTPNLRWVRVTGLRVEYDGDDIHGALSQWEIVRARIERVLASGRVRYLGLTDAKVEWIRTTSFANAIASWLEQNPAILRRLRGLSLAHVYPSVLPILARAESGSIEELELEGDLYGSGPVHPQDFAASSLQPRRARLIRSRAAWDAGTRTTKVLLASPFAARLEELETNDG